MPHPHQVFPDPGIQHGHFRVLPRTDGGFVVVDDRRPVADQAVKNKKGEVMRWAKAADAGWVAREWHRLGHG